MWRTYGVPFVVGAVSMFIVWMFWQSNIVCRSYLPLLNPNAVCSGSVEVSEWDYEPLRQELAQKINNFTTSKTVPRVALYFRDLKNGSRLSFREQEQFEPASLLKVPIMMVFLHQADQHPEILDERLTYTEDLHKDFIAGEGSERLALNSSYSIRELLEKMILFSDNSSALLLMDKINTLGLLEKSNVLSDLGSLSLLTSGRIDNTRLISLVNIFVALYNANYLSTQSSQFALNLLTQTNYDQAIVAGVPEGVTVAHKFGIRFGKDDAYGKSIGATNESQLHDCGIVYHSDTPYVLCVLTGGADNAVAAAAIKDISQLIYQHVDRVN